MRTVWASVDAEGRVKSGFGAEVTRQSEGRYNIQFTPSFQNEPAIVGSQTNHGDDNQSTTDGVVFPVVARNGAVALTGQSNGSHRDRSFSFIAIGE